MSISIISDLIGILSIVIRFGAETQNNMSSSQRVYEYTQLESEDKLVKDKD